MTDNTRSRIAALSMALVLLLSVVAGFGAGPAAGAGNMSVDTETTDTTYVSDLQSGTTVANMAGNDSLVETVSIRSDSNNTKVVIEHKADGYAVDVNSSGEFIATGSTLNYRNHTFTHADVIDVEHAPGENVTMLATAYNNTTLADADQVTTNFTWYAEFDNSTATEAITDGEVSASDFVTVSNESGTGLAFLKWGDADKTRVELTNQQVPNETFYVVAHNGSAADDFSSAIDAFDSQGKLSTVLGAGAVGPNAFVKIESDDKTVLAPVYGQEAPSDAEGVYVVATKDAGGSTGFAIHGMAQEFDSNTVDITVASGTGTNGWFVAYLTQGLPSLSMFGGFADFAGFVGGGLGSVAIAPAFIGARRRRAS